MQIPHKALVIHSPYSGKSGQFLTALAHLRESGVEVAGTISIADLDHLPAQGAQWREAGIELVVAAGGDGLIGGVITHIAESGLILGILPLGTANDIARSLNIPQDIRRAALVIANGTVKEADIGIARPAEQAPHLASKDQQRPVPERVGSEKHGYFAHTVTTGLNVQFARIATNVATRKRYGRLTYPVAAIETLKYHDALEVTLQFDGLVMPRGNRMTPYLSNRSIDPNTLRCRALQVTVINAPIFGGQWNLALPGVSINDRLLDVVVIEEIEFSQINANLAHLFGNHLHVDTANAMNASEPAPTAGYHPANLLTLPGFYHLQARGVTIATNADPRDATLDGEVRGQTPMYVHVAQERLRVMGPARV
ncbi:MAG TPA: diacylglycerol kinase family protein [Ktedonobacteraceae bacterium]|nr:diacylglycerol kinase family protein [Ktedonobacteraceae bacterium]